MPVPVLMPPLSKSGTGARLSRWLVTVGDAVEVGDVIAEAQTDAATIEIETENAGVIEKLLIAPGAQGVKVNAPIALLSDPALAGPETALAAGRRILSEAEEAQLFDETIGDGSGAACFDAAFGAALSGKRTALVFEDAALADDAMRRLLSVPPSIRMRTPLLIIRPHESRTPVDSAAFSGVSVFRPRAETHEAHIARALTAPNIVLLLEDSGLGRFVEKSDSGFAHAEPAPATQDVLIRAGDTATVIASGSGVGVALQNHESTAVIALDRLDAVLPDLVRDTIRESLAQTGRCVILATEDGACCWATRLAQMLTHAAFDDLDAPIELCAENPAALTAALDRVLYR